MADGFEVGVAFIRISPDTSDFPDELKAKVESAAAGAEAKVKVGGDDAELDAVLDDAKAKLDELDGKDATARLRAVDELSPKADEATARLREIGDAEATARLRMDKAAFDEEGDDAKAKLDEFDGKEASARLVLDKGEWDGQIADANAQLDELKAKAGGIRLGGSSGGPGGEGGGKGSLIGAAALGIGGLLPGAIAAGAGLGLLGGTGFLAFSGVGSALSAKSQADQATGTTAAQTAATNFSNQVQVQQAQESVSNARQQAAQDAKTADEQIQQADANLAETQRNTAASQVQALEQVQQAQQGVQSATYSLSQANYSLGQAYELAREQITQLNDQLADSKLSVTEASLAVQQAEYQEQLVSQSAYSTDLDRQQSTLAVAQAKQQLQDATDNETDAQYAANQANAAGVDGSQTVVQAKQAQLQATNQLGSAQQALTDANTSLKNTELNNAAQLKQAQQQAASAREQAAYQARQDAQSVADAERNLTNTIKEQQLQAAATASTANQAASQYLADMAKLTPAGRSFVNEVLSMKGAYTGLQAAAQTSALPGFTAFLKGAMTLLPEVRTGVTEMGGAISKAFAQMGGDLKTPQAVTDLNGLFANGTQFVNTVLPSMEQALGAIFNLGGSKGAATGLSNLFSGLFQGVAGFAKGLKPYIPDFNDIFTAVGKIAKAFGPALATDIGRVAQALDPLAKFLNSKQGQPFIDGIAKIIAGLTTVKGLAKILPGALGKAVGGAPGTILKLVSKPLKGMLSSAFKSAFGGAAKDGEKAAADELENNGGGWLSGLGGTLKSKLSPLFKGAFGGAAKDGEQAAEQELGSGGMSGLIGGIGSMLSGIPGKITPIVSAIKDWGIWSSIASGATKVWTGIQTAFDLVMDANPIGIVVLAIAGLVAGVVEAYKHFTWFRDGVKDAFGVIKDGALFLWHNVFDPAWHGIEAGATWLYNNAIKPLWNNWIKPVFDDIKNGVDLLSQHWKQVWAGMTAGILAPVNFLIQHVYDDGIAKLWDDVVDAVGLKSLRLPVVAALAGGGVLPGYAPGHDSVPAMLSPGEAVLTPGATRAIGGAPVVNALNAAHAPSSGSSSAHHFGGGGVVSDITGAVGALFSGGDAVAKAVAALATGNTTAFVNAIAPSIGTSASGALGQVMMALPKTLVTDAAKQAEGALSSRGAVGGAVAPSAQVMSWFSQAIKDAAAPASWLLNLETIGSHESSFVANAVNLSDSNAAAGTPSRGIMQLIPATFAQYHVPGTSDDIDDPVANIAAGIGYIRGLYGDPAHVPGIMSLGQGGKYVGYDSGGALPPGMTTVVNQTGKPEAVLNPQQMQWLQQAAERGPSTQQAAPVINMTYTGPQMPSHEQQAEMQRQLCLVLSGG